MQSVQCVGVASWANSAVERIGRAPIGSTVDCMARGRGASVTTGRTLRAGA